MAYVTNDDILRVINSVNLAELNEGDTTISDNAIETAKEQVRTYLMHRYNMTTEYAQTGSNRNLYLVNIIIDIALYHLHARINPRNVPEHRSIRYDDAIKWLSKASKGEVTANLALISPEQGNQIRYGYNEKNSTIY